MQNDKYIKDVPSLKIYSALHLDPEIFSKLHAYIPVLAVSRNIYFMDTFCPLLFMEISGHIP